MCWNLRDNSEEVICFPHTRNSSVSFFNMPILISTELKKGKISSIGNKHLQFKPQIWTHRAVIVWLATCIIYGDIIPATWGYGTGRFYMLSRYNFLVHQKIHIYYLQSYIILSSGPWYLLPFCHSLGLVLDPLLCCNEVCQI